MNVRKDLWFPTVVIRYCLAFLRMRGREVTCLSPFFPASCLLIRLTDSLHRCFFLWALLASLGRGHGLRAATIVPPLMSSPLPCVFFTMDSEGVRCWYWTLNSEAMTNAAILDLQLIAFWRHLCGDAFRRQSIGPSKRQRADAAQQRC